MLAICVPNWIRRSKFKTLIDKGNSKLDMALDIRTLIETTRTVSVLRKILLNKRQKFLGNLTKFSYLGSESSLQENTEHFKNEHETKMTKLYGYKIANNTDRRLMSLV
jgi:hypothetical protein